MELNLQGNRVVVFGAARGIGRAMAETFRAEQCTVIAADLTVNNTEDSEMLDVTDYSAVQALATKLFHDLGRVDHIAFAVGVGSGKFGFPFWNLEPADWQKVLQVNLIGAVNVAHAFGPLMAKKGNGSMLFLSSVAGQIGSQTDPPYSAAKAGLINFVQCAAKDLAPFHVRVNCLCPGMVKTELNKSVWQAWADRQPVGSASTYEEWADEKVKRVVPLGRWQSADDIAQMAVFLASERARNITGQTINIDGGYVMR